MMKRTFLGGHFDEILVKVGDKVRKGQAIATLGHTGYTRPEGRGGEHLHFVILRGAVDRPFYMSEGPRLGASKEDTIDFSERLQFRKNGKIVPSRITGRYGVVTSAGDVHYAIDMVVDYYDNAEVLWPEDDGVVVDITNFGTGRTGKTLMIQYGGSEPDKGGIYTVRKGDTLWAISQAHGTTVAEMVDANAENYPSLVRNPDAISIGWKLTIPSEKEEKAQPGDIVKIDTSATAQVFDNRHLVIEGPEAEGITWIRIGVSDKWVK